MNGLSGNDMLAPLDKQIQRLGELLSVQNS